MNANENIVHLRRDKGIWKKIIRRDPCCYCGKSGGTADHIVAKAIMTVRDIESTWENYTGACARCNVSKGTKSWNEFMLEDK